MTILKRFTAKFITAALNVTNPLKQSNLDENTSNTLKTEKAASTVWMTYKLFIREIIVPQSPKISS